MTGSQKLHFIDERRSYTPHGPLEQFIVPLLAEHIERALIEHCANPKPGSTVLDVGCGGQPLRSRLEALGYRYAGADPRPLPGVDVDYVWKLDDPGPPPDLTDRGGFPLVVCTEVLEHVADWALAWRNLAALMSAGGRLLVTCPAFYALHEEPWDFWRPTDHALQHFSELHGFSIVHRERLGDGLDVLGTLLASLRIQSGSLRRSDHYLARLLESFRGAVFRGLRPDSWLRGHVTSRAGIYLSNLMVLEKPDTK